MYMLSQAAWTADWYDGSDGSKGGSGLSQLVQRRESPKMVVVDAARASARTRPRAVTSEQTDGYRGCVSEFASRAHVPANPARRLLFVERAVFDEPGLGWAVPDSGHPERIVTDTGVRVNVVGGVVACGYSRAVGRWQRCGEYRFGQVGVGMVRPGPLRPADPCKVVWVLVAPVGEHPGPGPYGCVGRFGSEPGERAE